MLAHVYEAARACSDLQDVIVATDSEEIAAVCRQNGWRCRLTSPAHRSGTERVHEVAQTIAAMFTSTCRAMSLWPGASISTSCSS